MTYPSFNSGEVLTASDMNAVGLWRITGCTVTSVGGTAATASNGVITIGNGNTSVTVSSAFSADFENYKIIISGGGTSAAENIRLKLGSSITGYYDAVLYISTAATTTPLATGTSNGALFARIGAADTNGIHVNVDINNPQLAKYTSFSGVYTFPGTPAFPGMASGIHQVATAYTEFTVSPGSGSFTGGTIRVYGYRK